MVKTLIAAFPTVKKEAQKDNSAILNIAENFCDTIQGENWSGYPSVFLRLQHCTLNCVYCDSVLEGTLIRTSETKWLPIEQIIPEQNILGVVKEEKGENATYRYFYEKATALRPVSHKENKAIKISWRDGDIITTYNHKFFVERNNKWQWVEAQYLKKSDLLWSIGKASYKEDTGDFIDGWLAGYTAGDGGWSDGRRVQRRWETITFEIAERLRKYLSYKGIEFQCYSRIQRNRIYTTDANFEPLIKETDEYKRGFVSGFYDAEGSNDGHRAVFSNKEINLLETVKNYLINSFKEKSIIADTKANCSQLYLKLTIPERLHFDSYYSYSKSHYNKWLWRVPGIRGKIGKVAKHQGKNKEPITDIEYITGDFTFYDIGSSTENFFANGVLVHNTTEVWRKGNPYSVTELLDLWEKEGVIERFKNKHHLVITGGSPLLQMQSIESLILEFKTRFLFKPFIEVENECMIHPSLYMFKIVDRWNNSPKLTNSGMKFEIRYRPDIIRKMSCIPRSDFKFVISSSEDWGEIQRDYLDEDLISKSQIVLMPEGSTREQLQKNYDKVVDLCCEQGVRMSDRMQVTIWDKSVGV